MNPFFEKRPECSASRPLLRRRSTPIPWREYRNQPVLVPFHVQGRSRWSYWIEGPQVCYPNMAPRLFHVPASTVSGNGQSRSHRSTRFASHVTSPKPAKLISFRSSQLKGRSYPANLLNIPTPSWPNLKCHTKSRRSTVPARTECTSARSPKGCSQPSSLEST
jgi:hypothetical protein